MLLISFLNLGFGFYLVGIMSLIRSLQDEFNTIDGLALFLVISALFDCLENDGQ